MEVDATEADTGQLLLDNWAAGLRKMEGIRAAHDRRHFLDIHIDELRADPVRAVERVYEYFDFPVTVEARTAWRTQAARERAAVQPGGGSTPHFGLTRENVDSALGAYYERYRRVAETGSRRSARATGAISR